MAYGNKFEGFGTMRIYDANRTQKGRVVRLPSQWYAIILGEEKKVCHNLGQVKSYLTPLGLKLGR